MLWYTHGLFTAIFISVLSMPQHCFPLFTSSTLIQIWILICAHIFVVGDMVVYVLNGTIVAGGHVQPQRENIHGFRIPPDYYCYDHNHQTKPCSTTHSWGWVWKLFSGKGKFFALPTKCLMTARLLANDSLALLPYVYNGRK